MSDAICYADATELAARIRAKELSPVEVMRAHLQRIAAINPRLQAIVTLVEGAMDQARQAEAALMRGESWGPLHGVPFTIKDCVDTAGVRTTRGSKLFAEHVPSVDATVVTRLKHAGGIFMAKTNMPEFALWWETGNRVFGRTENPWKQGHTAGGSSGGEASAIAAGLSPLGIGSDVGGSIRQPAHYCGIVGLKATHGRIPLTGHWPETLLRFMHVGPMARTVRDVALALTVLAGPDGLDPYALPVTAPPVPELRAALPKLRVGWCAAGPFAPVAPEVQDTVARAASALKERGCQVEPVALTAFAQRPAQSISLALFTAEGGLYLEPIIAGRQDELAPSMQWRLALPTPTLREYLEALADCEALRHAMAHYFTQYDLLLCPTGTVLAHAHEAPELLIGDHRVPPRHAIRATVPFDLTGSPAISVPFGMGADGLPIGVQLVARHFDEATLLHVAAALEGLHEASTWRPPLAPPEP
jgi:Asp-tRNA(Asn)/Glu-tRNA(Gln) amidotransferase A subunit family amidase